MSGSNAHTDELADELEIPGPGTAAVVRLLDEGSTVPFIARYRKEATGGLDEQQIITIRDRLGQLRQRDKRRLAVLKSLKEQKKLTDALQRLPLPSQLSKTSPSACEVERSWSHFGLFFQLTCPPKTDPAL